MLRIIHPNRWFIWTIALIVMVFIVVWGAVQRYAIEQEYGYTADEIYYSIRIQRKQTPPEQSSIDTSDWKTYRNEEYGFGFRYSVELGQVQKNNYINGRFDLGDDFSISLSTRNEAKSYDQQARESSIKCWENPLEYGTFLGDCGDPNTTDYVQEWDADKTFLDSAKIGDNCTAKANYACNVVDFRGKAIRRYSGGCFEGCSTWKTLIFYNGPNRYEIVLRLVNGDSIPMSAVESLERSDEHVRMLNAIVETFRLQ